MDEATILRVVNEPPWSKKKFDEAARGLPNASCDDPSDVQLKFWLEMARGGYFTWGDTTEDAVNEIIREAREGYFK